jgi:paraquat-inducible protein B
MQQLITRLLYNLNELPLNETVESLRGAVDRLEQVLLSAQGILDDESTRELTATLQQSLVEATAALQSFKPEAPLQKDLQRTLSDFKGAMQSLDRLADRLEANPNALVFPSRISDDPVPEAPGARSE